MHRPSLQGSVFWMAPEVVKQTQYTRKADIWSVGCLIVEMLTGEHPWAQLNQMQAIFKVLVSATFTLFITDLLVRSVPSKRNQRYPPIFLWNVKTFSIKPSKSTITHVQLRPSSCSIPGSQRVPRKPPPARRRRQNLHK